MIHRNTFFTSSIFLLCYILLVSSGYARTQGEVPVVSANSEELHGAWDATINQIAVFRGVPFAKPPVADLRWRAPVANQARIGPQKATEFAPACMQTSYSTDWYASIAEAFGSGPETVGRPVGVSEDCLYLNIWTPNLSPDADLPVMVWVHGGSNVGGWSYEPNYVGKNLAAKGVVVVTVAYRMGAFGFFSHPALDNGALDNGKDQAVANFGLLDVAQASRWVTDNIKSFGGDAQNITLIGESSGAGNISDLISIEIGQKQTFRRAILQSSASSLGKRRTLEQEQALGTRLINSMAINEPITAQRLRSISSEDLLAAYMKTLQDHYFDAVIDGLSMKQSPIEALKQMKKTDLDILIGTNADEWLMYINENSNQSDLEKVIEQNAPEHADALTAELTDPQDARRAIDRVRTAADTLCPSRYLAARVSETGGRAWVYYFSRQRPGPGGEKLGAYHGTEIPYVFGIHDDWLPTEDIDHELTDAVMDYWVQFAHSGDPNIPNRPQWPVYTHQQQMVMELGDWINSMPAHDAGLCELLGPKN